MRVALLAVLGLIGAAGHASAAPKGVEPPAGMARVGPGVYRPLYPAAPSERELPVAAFFLDKKPVSNEKFSSFVRAQPAWNRARISRLFADEGYLAHWQAHDELGPSVRAGSPVTHVSWFAAKAYCASLGGRLPTEREWELAAAASETARDGSNDPRWLQRILSFYSQPATSLYLPDAGAGKPNFWGLYDMHGLVWEWIYDYGASLVASDSREKGDSGSNRFCGASGADSRNPTDYASFMRIAMRSSLAAPYTTARLGFRCARDLKVEP